MRIHVLGANGMLGNYVYTYLKDLYDCVPYTRKEIDAVENINEISKILGLESGDYVINCIGTIKPQVESVGHMNTFIVNGLWPHMLHKTCARAKAKMFHITTDCIFSGEKGRYTELDRPTQYDEYGLSKYFGELGHHCTIRTSIIGEEKSTSRSLVEWALSQAGKEVSGFKNHLWNGVTCLQVAKVIEQLIEQNVYWEGVRHLFTHRSHSKLEMLQLFDSIYSLGLIINAVDAASECDRTLSTFYTQPLAFSSVPTLHEQIREMKDFNIKERGL
jgi:dTDP-4-dehydrorhamnose reductase